MLDILILLAVDKAILAVLTVDFAANNIEVKRYTQFQHQVIESRNFLGQKILPETFVQLVRPVKGPLAIELFIDVKRQEKKFREG